MNVSTPPQPSVVTRVFLGVEVTDPEGRHAYEVSGQPLSPASIELLPSYEGEQYPESVTIRLDMTVRALPTEPLYVTRDHSLEVEQ